MALVSARFRARTTINQAAISSFFQPGGDAFRDMQQFMRSWKARATADAPVGRAGRPFAGDNGGRGVSRAFNTRSPGNLARSHVTRTLPGGIYGCHGVLINDAYYSAFVHDGTTGPIQARGGRLMPIPTLGQRGSARLNPGVVFRQTVRGQRAQPWMVDALQPVMVEYRR